MRHILCEWWDWLGIFIRYYIYSFSIIYLISNATIAFFYHYMEIAHRVSDIYFFVAPLTTKTELTKKGKDIE